MPTKILRDPAHVDALAALLLARKLPLTVSWVQGAKHTDAQQRLAQRWFTDISRQLGDQTHEDIRAECKVMFAVPILRRDNLEFRGMWDSGLGLLRRDMQTEQVRVLDVPMTRNFKVDQMTEFMDEVSRFWVSHGIRLTDPEAMKYEEEFA